MATFREFRFVAATQSRHSGTKHVRVVAGADGGGCRAKQHEGGYGADCKLQSLPAVHSPTQRRAGPEPCLITGMLVPKGGDCATRALR